MADIFTLPASLAGLPGMSMPVGFGEAGMPVGMQLIGPPRSEHRLLAAGAWLEQQFGLHERVPLLPQTRV